MTERLEFADKHAQALAVLKSAELHTGVTPVVQPEVALESDELVPGGRIAPGSVISVAGSRMLQYHLLATASQAGGWVAVVGQADLGVVALEQAGLELSRVALIPNPGGDAGIVCAALLDAMWVVIGSDVSLRDSERRRLAARARERGTVIITSEPWPGAHLTFRVTARNWVGVNQGEGWLKGCHLTVERIGRGSAARPGTFWVDLGFRSDIGFQAERGRGGVP